MTSVLYFIIATLFVPMLAYYITKAKINLLKRIVYVLILICILATAFFPFNTFSDTPTAMTINLHNSFAIVDNTLIHSDLYFHQNTETENCVCVLDFLCDHVRFILLYRIYSFVSDILHLGKSFCGSSADRIAYGTI